MIKLNDLSINIFYNFHKLLLIISSISIIFTSIITYRWLIIPNTIFVSNNNNNIFFIVNNNTIFFSIITVSLEIYSTTPFSTTNKFPLSQNTRHNHHRFIHHTPQSISKASFPQRQYQPISQSPSPNPIRPFDQPSNETLLHNSTSPIEFTHTYTHTSLLWRTKLTVQSLPWPAQNPSKPIHRVRCSLTLPPRGNRP